MSTKPHPQISSAKTETVTHIKDLLASAKSVAVVDYTGLKVSQATALRQTIRKAGGQLLVTKNTLFQIALGQHLELSGLNAFVFSTADEVSAIKAVVDFSKKNNVLTIKSGLLGVSPLTAEQTTQLANIPDKNTLVAKLAGSFKSPLFRLALALNWNQTKLVRTLQAVKEVRTK